MSNEALIRRMRFRAKQYMSAELYDQASILTEAADALSAPEAEPAALHGIKNGVMLEPADLRFLMEQAGIGEGFDEGDAAAVVLWVGDTIDMDDGVESRQYGLNVYNIEVPEEGSCCLKELPRPAAPSAPAAPAAGVDVGEVMALVREYASKYATGCASRSKYAKAALEKSEELHEKIRCLLPAPAVPLRAVTPLRCPKCFARWLFWPSEQSGFGQDTLSLISPASCAYCEPAGSAELESLNRVEPTVTGIHLPPAPKAKEPGHE